MILIEIEPCPEDICDGSGFTMGENGEEVCLCIKNKKADIMSEPSQDD